MQFVFTVVEQLRDRVVAALAYAGHLISPPASLSFFDRCAGLAVRAIAADSQTPPFHSLFAAAIYPPSPLPLEPVLIGPRFLTDGR